MLIPNHPDDERLSALASGDPEAAADAVLTEHLATCIRCTDTVAELGALRASLAELPDLQPHRPLRLLPPVDEPAPSRTDRRRWLGAPVLRPDADRRCRAGARRTGGDDGPDPRERIVRRCSAVRPRSTQAETDPTASAGRTSRQQAAPPRRWAPTRWRLAEGGSATREPELRRLQPLQSDREVARRRPSAATKSTPLGLDDAIDLADAPLCRRRDHDRGRAPSLDPRPSRRLSF